MKIELVGTTRTLLQEIGDKRMKRNDVAMVYALALRSSETTDWKAVNEAIVKRWSLHALDWIKTRAWSGKCFAKAKAEAY